jgi:uncharacterized protein YjbI with pentapeptide repeats
MQKADMSRSQFLRATLPHADLREANLQGVTFRDAILQGARLGGADTFTTDFRGADLKGARELTKEQLSQALTDSYTILPNGSRGPYVKHSGSERPR